MNSEEILTYLILIAIGYFIAKMFSRCTNGVDGFNVSAYKTSKGCTKALNKLCGYTENLTDKACYDCSASVMNQQKLRAAGCNEYDIANYCKPTPGVGGRLISPSYCPRDATTSEVEVCAEANVLDGRCSNYYVEHEGNYYRCKGSGKHESWLCERNDDDECIVPPPTTCPDESRYVHNCINATMPWYDACGLYFTQDAIGDDFHTCSGVMSCTGSDKCIAPPGFVP